MRPMLVSCPRFWAKVRGYELHKRFITYMSLNQDSKCDANCQGCFRYPGRKAGLKNLLGRADYVRLIEEFKRFGGLALEISGEGEPLLSEHTLPIIRTASAAGIWTTLITNGHLLTEEIACELGELRVALVLSLHSLTRETYESDCGLVGGFNTKINTLNMVARVFKDTDWTENGVAVKRVAVHWTLQANNLNEVEGARVFCDVRGLLFSIAPLARTGHAANTPELWLPAEKRLEAVNALGDESIIFYDEPDGRVVCGTCKYGLNIGADGNLLLDAHGGYEVEIANIRDVSFEQAVEMQHRFSRVMFNELNCFCPVRDMKWPEFLARQRYV